MICVPQRTICGQYAYCNMLLARTAKFGRIATLGVAFVSVATGWVIWREYTTTVSGQDPALSLILVIGVTGLTVSMIFLFIVIGEYVDRELEAKGLARLEE